MWCTAATRDLAVVMLADSAHIQEKDAEFLAPHGKSAVPPLYSMVDATRTADIMAGVPYRSAHADRTELVSWLDAVRATSPALRDVYLVHGEPDPQDALATQLRNGGFRVTCPEPFARINS